MPGKETEHDKLLNLYEFAIDEQHYYLDAHQKRIDFYVGLLSALMTGTGIGLFQASEWYHLAFVSIGPILIFAISAIAIGGTFRMYQRLLESITVRAKIEQLLGLTSRQPEGADAPGSYWRSEAIIPHRHMESRKKYESSRAFIAAHTTKGYHLWTILLFVVFMVLSVVTLFGLVFLATLKALGCL